MILFRLEDREKEPQENFIDSNSSNQVKDIENYENENFRNKQQDDSSESEKRKIKISLKRRRSWLSKHPEIFRKHPHKH